MQCFSVLLLGKVVELSKFLDRRSLNPRLLRLSLFDWYHTSNSFNDYITKPTENGFFRYWYSVSDDSKHFRLDRHAVMITVREKDSDPPSFKLLTISASASKDSKGNKKMNQEVFNQKLRPLTMYHYGGNMTDNANDTKKESRDTFSAVLPSTRIEHGVVPKPLNSCDPFHIDNLAVTNASVGAFGETERNNHRQRHHRQCMQSIYDLMKIDPITHQALMDELLEATDMNIKIKVMRERVQQWLANQRNASWIVEMYNQKIDNESVLILWAHAVGNHSNSENVKTIAKDVIEMLLMPQIIIALNFEREMGLYFEVTS